MEAENSGQSKLFVVLVVSLVGLLVLGLVGIGGVFVLRKNMAQQILSAQPTSTLVVKLPPAITPTPRVEQPPTNTPEPTPTNTPVIQSGNNVAPAAAGNLGDENETQVTDSSAIASAGGGDADTSSEPTPKPSPTPADADSTSESETTDEDSDGNTEVTTADTVPDTGLNAFQSIMLALGLVTVLLVARRLRTS
ncbi:hypothetical protein QUF64_12980 [Anaerolineales bacterium HSG6]|nr:hypothetical protein [Anaerolineales bacterium HSG6]MDM8532606.1 hypothetical protein [Anaerolineales bacterium HSG25]